MASSACGTSTGRGFGIRALLKVASSPLHELVCFGDEFSCSLELLFRILSRDRIADFVQTGIAFFKSLVKIPAEFSINPSRLGKPPSKLRGHKLVFRREFLQVRFSEDQRRSSVIHGQVGILSDIFKIRPTKVTGTCLKPPLRLL